MHPKRKQRILLISLLLLGVSSAVSIALVALNKNINLFFSPSQIAAGEAPVGVTFRLGGMVVTGSVNRDPGSLNVTFNLTDTAQHINVEYSGILPDLFREGQGIVAMGSLVNGRFVATEVLAKHDENYMPPEVKEALKQAELAGVSRVNNQ